MVGFQDLPRAYLSPADPAALAIEIRAVNFQTAAEITGVIPSGLSVGDYDVIVVNPDQSVGILVDGFKVTADQPPLIDTISPVSVPNSASQSLEIVGSGFDGAVSVSLECRNLSNVVTSYAVTINSASATVLDTTVPADSIEQGSVCIVRATNPDTSYGEFAALGVTNPAENLPAFEVKASMITARRALAATNGRPTSRTRFIYGIGGDDGTVAPGNVYDTLETTALDRYGEPIGWRELPLTLPGPRTFGSAVTIGRFIYVVGGDDGSGALDSAVRAEILDPTDVPTISEVALDLQPAGLTQGIWFYRVSAVMGAADPDNPSGETLPSDAQPVQVPAGLSDPLEAEITWTAVVGAVSYRVYRSPVAGAGAGNEQLLAVVAAPTTSYPDTGTATVAEIPRQLGDLGEWVTSVAPPTALPTEIPSLGVAREGFGLVAARDPLAASETWYLYAVGGRDGGGTARNDYQYITINVDAGGGHTLSSSWTTGAELMPTGRWQMGAFIADRSVTTRVASDEMYVFAGPGYNSTAASVINDVDAARIDLTTVGQEGKLLPWQAVDSTSAAGYGSTAAANQLFIFGGANGSPSTNNVSAEICGPGSNCPPAASPPDLANWNSTASLNTARYLPGSAVESAHIFILGGDTGSVITNTVESTVW